MLRGIVLPALAKAIINPKIVSHEDAHCHQLLIFFLWVRIAAFSL
jgi:hypothetical protein